MFVSYRAGGGPLSVCGHAWFRVLGALVDRSGQVQYRLGDQLVDRYLAFALPATDRCKVLISRNFEAAPVGYRVRARRCKYPRLAANFR
jgi:hypothetical protein